MSYQATLLIVNEFGQVLARRQEAKLTLPEVEVEEGRVGISLSRAVRQRLNLEIFCLVLPETPPTPLSSRPERTGTLPFAIPSIAEGSAVSLNPQTNALESPNDFRQSDLRFLHVLRLQPSRKLLPLGLTWVSPEQLPHAEEIHALVDQVSATAESFGGYAWYGRVALWLQQQLRGLGHAIEGLEQWNGRIGGVLLRVITNGPDFWFKAVSDFNLRETAIAQLLAAKHPAHFPRILAVEPTWNAFLLEHVAGTELYDCDDLETWKEVARQLADVQIDWAGNSGSLLKARAADLRARTMIAKIPDFLDHIDDAMARQSKTPPTRLTRVDLDELGSALYPLCADVASLKFADGLANADFSPHNTLITSRAPVFIDWAEACVTLPLIAGEYLWNRMVVESPDRVQWRNTLRTVYLRRWAEAYGETEVEAAATLLPAFSIFAVAMFYHQRECHGPSPYDSYLRSLARKLESALQRYRGDNYVVEGDRLQPSLVSKSSR